MLMPGYVHPVSCMRDGSSFNTIQAIVSKPCHKRSSKGTVCTQHQQANTLMASEDLKLGLGSQLVEPLPHTPGKFQGGPGPLSDHFWRDRR